MWKAPRRRRRRRDKYCVYVEYYKQHVKPTYNDILHWCAIWGKVYRCCHLLCFTLLSRECGDRRGKKKNAALSIKFRHVPRWLERCGSLRTGGGNNSAMWRNYVCDVLDALCYLYTGEGRYQFRNDFASAHLNARAVSQRRLQMKRQQSQCRRPPVPLTAFNEPLKKEKKKKHWILQTTHSRLCVMKMF